MRMKDIQMDSREIIKFVETIFISEGVKIPVYQPMTISIPIKNEDEVVNALIGFFQSLPREKRIEILEWIVDNWFYIKDIDYHTPLILDKT